MRPAHSPASHEAYPICDDRRWPIVVITLPEVPLGGPAFSAHMQQLLSYFARGEDFAIVVNARHAPMMQAEQRRVLAENLDRWTTEYRDVHLYVAVIIGSSIQRGIVKTITWMSQQPRPNKVFSSIEEGISWCRAMLAEGASTRPRAAP